MINYWLIISSSLIDWFDWLIDWLIDWSIDWLIVWLIDWLIDWLIVWLIDWLIELTGWLAGYLVPTVDQVGFSRSGFLRTQSHSRQKNHSSTPEAKGACLKGQKWAMLVLLTEKSFKNMFGKAYFLQSWRNQLLKNIYSCKLIFKRFFSK